MKIRRAIVRELISIPNMLITKMFHYKGFYCHILQDIAPTVKFYFENGGTIKLGRIVHIKRNTEINVSKNALIEIGNNTCINSNCYIASMSKVSIGNRCELGPGVIIVDHDHNFRDKNGISSGSYKTSTIEIGNDVWIGGNSVILMGTTIGSGSVVAAGSVVKGSFPENSIIIQKRDTEVSIYR